MRELDQDGIVETFILHLRDRRFVDPWAYELVSDLMCVERDGTAPGIETAWQVLLLAIVRSDDEKILCGLGVSVLEILLNGWGEQFIDRVEQEAASNEQFAKALRCVWPDDSEVVFERVVTLLNEVGRS